MKKLNTQYFILTTLFKLFMVKIRSNLVLLLRGRGTNQVIHFLSNRKRGSNLLCEPYLLKASILGFLQAFV